MHGAVKTQLDKPSVALQPVLEFASCPTFCAEATAVEVALELWFACLALPLMAVAESFCNASPKGGGKIIGI